MTSKAATLSAMAGEKALARKLRNRESAAASRARQKEYTHALEVQVETLKARIREMEAELAMYKPGGRVVVTPSSRSPHPHSRGSGVVSPVGTATPGMVGSKRYRGGSQDEEWEHDDGACRSSVDGSVSTVHAGSGRTRRVKARYDSDGDGTKSELSDAAVMFDEEEDDDGCGSSSSGSDALQVYASQENDGDMSITGAVKSLVASRSDLDRDHESAVLVLAHGFNRF